jgi:hypothetical protein
MLRPQNDAQPQKTGPNLLERSAYVEIDRSADGLLPPCFHSYCVRKSGGGESEERTFYGSGNKGQ